MNNQTHLPTTNESDRLRELVREIGLPLRKLQEIISLKHEDCLAWWSNKEIQLKSPRMSYQRLTALVGIDENLLFTGQYDRDLARKRMLGDHCSLPGRYQENQNSFLRTSAHIIHYITLTRGQLYADQILFSLNVSPLVYQDLNTKINLIYFADLLEALAQRGFSQDELDTLASVIFLSLSETPLGQKFSTSESVFDIYATLAKNFDYFDSNFEYKSQFVGKKYILKTLLPLNEQPLLRAQPENIQRLMRYRHILLAWFPYLAGKSPVFPKTKVLRVSDVVEMQYEFDLTPDAKLPTKLLVV